MSYEISRTYGFEAAHLLPRAPADHKCRRLHGHSFKVEIRVAGGLVEPEGWVCDFAKIDEAWAPLHEALDHQYLNDVDGLENPTSEKIAAWIWKRVEESLPGLSTVLVAETCTSECVFQGP